MNFARSSLALALIQLAIVSSIAAKYLYQRSSCPKVWTRAVAYDPELIMRGRYLSIQLHIDACQINLPISREQSRNQYDQQTHFDLANEGRGTFADQLPVIVGVREGKLVAERMAVAEEVNASQELVLRGGSTCVDATLWQPVDFFLSDTAKSPFPLPTGSELWVEVTVPPKGPPRPIALALKNTNGNWHPLNY